ncbi:helix-turn-helix transcriptional regulator [Geodermatophilus sp. SYSU D00815]
MSGTATWPGLLGRRTECELLTSTVAAAQAGRSQVLVLRGEAGIGKTALLDFLVARAGGCTVGRAAGVESEMELAYAGLHQLCSPFLDRLGELPGPQQEALATTFKLRAGSAPDRFLVGLAVLTLLAEVAEERPLVCVVDDAQWLDRASLETLEFVARRLVAEPVAVVVAVRDTDEPPVMAGFPVCVVRGLRPRDAAALLQTAVTGTFDLRVRDRILAEAHGNPLALLELPRGLTTAEVVFGGATGSTSTPLVRRLEQGFLRQVTPLPAPSRRLLLTAAAEPVGDVALLRRATEQLGIDFDSARAAEAAGLVEFGEWVRFRHPLVRSAVYRSATPAERRLVHGALAEATDPDVDPDRRAWHRSRSVVGPDEEAAAELERSAGRALAHGGWAAAAAFLEQATALTPEPARRVRRSLDAAQAKLHAGQLDDAAVLLTTAEAGPLGVAERARADLLRAQLAFLADRGSEALPLLLAAARQLEPVDPSTARDTYLDALSAALFAGRLAAGPGAREVAGAVRAAPRPHAPRKDDVLLDGLAVLFTEGYAAAVPRLRQGVRGFVTEDLTVDEGLRFAWLAAATAASLWDDGNWDVLTRRHLAETRQAGALSALPLALNTRAVVQVFSGDLASADSSVQEAEWVGDVTTSGLAPYGAIALLAFRGAAEEAEPLFRSCLADVVSRGEGVGVDMVQWARSVLFNGLGRYGDALRAAQEAAADPLRLGPPKWALAELVEAGARGGDTGAATSALAELSALTRASGTDWALGIEASRRALLSTDDAAERLHLEGIERLGRTRIGPDLARARLLYGEWLRRVGRRVDARVQLRTAHQELAAMGLTAFADRARRELLATGETARKRTVETFADLTAQEAHIARLAAGGLTNPEIGAMLFISPRTVEWHLRKIFPKLGVTGRRELRRTLQDSAVP